MMHQTGEFTYFSGATFQALQMLYVGKDLSMVILLPRKSDGLAALEKSLTAEKVHDLFDKLHSQEVIVTLPRFKMTSEFSLKTTLSALGMPTAFSSKADLSGLNGGKESLYLSDVVHKAFVNVNEEGTEAAGATGVIVKAESKSTEPTPEFRADHPFVFLIRDTRSDSILFLGRVTNPQE
jgi:serpin B